MIHEKRDKIFKKLESITNLPTLPRVLDRLREEMRNPNSNAAGMASIIQDDPSMMARILKVVNSPLYAGAGKIESLQLAISRLGMRTINNIALSTSVFSTLKSGSAMFDPKEFWRHSIATGLAMNVFYDRCQATLGKRFTRDHLHLVGLMHDIGKIVFQQYFPEEFESALQNSMVLKVPLHQMELEMLGADHCQVGRWLGEKWSLSPELIEAIRWHHEPDSAADEHKTVALLCHLANYACNHGQIGHSGDAVAPAFFRSVWKRLGVDENELPAIENQIKEEALKSEVLLSLS